MKTVSMLEIAQRVAPGAVENAQSVLDSALREIHSELCRGNTVDLPVPLVLSLSPAVAASPHEDVTQVLDIAAVESAAQTYHIMYAVAEKDFFTNVTAQRLTGSRSRVTVVEGKDDTLASVRQDRPEAADDWRREMFAVIGLEMDRCIGDAGFDLDRLTRSIGLSHRYVQRVMARHGTTFSALLREKRMEFAHSRLASRRCKIEEVVAESGYSELSAFYRAFKRQFGYAPGAVRRPDTAASAQV